MVQSGSWLASEAGVTVDTKWGGAKTFFSGEGLFYAALTGPGRIWLQTLPFSRLANRLSAAMGGSREQNLRGPDFPGKLLPGQ